MRRKIQIGLCILLAVASVATVLGIWIFQKNKIKEPLVPGEAVKKEEENTWEKENHIDWDAYFEEGGYFGDYGDESIVYQTEVITGINIQAEYATIHLEHSEEVNQVEVFTQIGEENDAISCNVEDGILTIVQANLDEDSVSDGSYIEVVMPSDLVLDSLSLTQKKGVTSLALLGEIRHLKVQMDGGYLYGESLHGEDAFFDTNDPSIHIKELVYDKVEFQNITGSLHMNVLQVHKEMSVNNDSGTISCCLWEPREDYDFRIRNIEGTVEIDGGKETELSFNQEQRIPIQLETRTGSMYIDTNGKND